jgi:hypothetical protein
MCALSPPHFSSQNQIRKSLEISPFCIEALSFNHFLFWSLVLDKNHIPACALYIFAPEFHNNSYYTPVFLHRSTPTFCISKYAPETSKILVLALGTSFLRMFSTVTLNQVIVVPKFSGSHPLSLQSIHILMIAAFV